MTAVFVHGVPDTYRVWDRVRAQLTRKDVVALALPGFDNPAPAGFTSTKEAYADWIIQQLETIGTPVDLVGHDWGCMLTTRVASIRPDLVRTWTGTILQILSLTLFEKMPISQALSQFPPPSQSTDYHSHQCLLGF
jgi:hypothetical protein